MQLSDRAQVRLLAVIALVLAGVVTGQLWWRFGSSQQVSQPSAGSMTLAPAIADSLTALPQATPLAGEAGGLLTDLETMMAACAAYSDERRRQMQQHITWLQNPAEIPRDVAIALGENPTARLIFGMATYTSTQWRLDERPPESCLMPIGETLNQMLVSFGEQPFTIYDEESTE